MHRNRQRDKAISANIFKPSKVALRSLGLVFLQGYRDKTIIKEVKNINLFNLNDDDNELLNDKDREIYHAMVAKGIFLAKRG